MNTNKTVNDIRNTFKPTSQQAEQQVKNYISRTEGHETISIATAQLLGANDHSGEHVLNELYFMARTVLVALTKPEVSAPLIDECAGHYSDLTAFLGRLVDFCAEGRESPATIAVLDLYHLKNLTVPEAHAVNHYSNLIDTYSRLEKIADIESAE